jgi:hypothetical protein
MVPGFTLAGVGFGLTMPASTAAALGRVPDDKTGVASGVLNTLRQFGGALGLAVTGAIVVNSVGEVLPGDPEFAPSYVTGTHNGLRVAAVVAFAGALIAALTVREPAVLTAPREEVLDA